MKKNLFVLFFAGILFFSFAIIMKIGDAVPASSNTITNHDLPTLIIDPGHGGEDGGAIGVDGTVESQINLEISLKAADIARLIGIPVIMTRNKDISIYDEKAETLRQKKISDLKNRVSICEEVDNGLLISFHQNSLPEANTVKGAQVFYYNENACLELATEIQHQLNRYFNIGREKNAKFIGASSYLMRNVSCPAILIECGFLSNYDECKLLQTKEYQNKLALVIMRSAHIAFVS